MRTFIISTVTGIALSLLAATAFGADKGTVIKRDDLPASIKSASSKKDPKFPGIPACAKGRALFSGSAAVEYTQGLADNHPCVDASEVYVCQAFGKVSVRCEDTSK